MAPRNEETADWQVKYPEIRLRSGHLLKTGEWADCSFQFPTIAGAEAPTILYAHKLILAMASPVFAAMVYGDVGDKESPVNISDVDRPTFSALLRYIYTDEAIIPDVEAAISLYKAANKYILVHLEKKCLDFLSEALMNPTNVCRIYEFASFFGERLLEEKCLKEISTKTELVLNSPDFRYADTNTLKKIVSMDKLDIKSEMELFNALVAYANFNKPDDSQNLESQPSQVKMDLGEGDNDKQTYKEADDNNAKSPENKASNSSTKKPQDARSILKGIIEEVRFLSMTPTELLKIGESTTILSKEELFSLVANVCYPDTRFPMPGGFSCVREPRIRNLATSSLFFGSTSRQ